MYHLALHAGRQAWQDASTSNLDLNRVGVVLGNIALPTDKASALTRGSWAERVAEKVLGPEKNRDSAEAVRLAQSLTSAGLPAALLAQALGLGGGSYTLDAACASSLYALKLAADELSGGPGRRDADRRRFPAGMPLHADGLFAAAGPVAVGPLRALRRRGGRPGGRRRLGHVRAETAGRCPARRRPASTRCWPASACPTTCTAGCWLPAAKGNCGPCGPPTARRAGARGTWT